MKILLFHVLFLILLLLMCFEKKIISISYTLFVLSSWSFGGHLMVYLGVLLRDYFLYLCVFLLLFRGHLNVFEIMCQTVFFVMSLYMFPLYLGPNFIEPPCIVSLLHLQFFSQHVLEVTVFR